MTDYTGSNTPADQRDLWRTPPALFASLDAEFCFQLDAAAAPHNALCRKFITAEQNTLEKTWADYLNVPGYVWLNPPYSDIMPFVKKAASESANQIGTVMLVPADTSVGWFKEAMRIEELPKLPKLFRVIEVDLDVLRNGIGSGWGVIFDQDAIVKRKVRRVKHDGGWKWQLVREWHDQELWDYCFEQDRECLENLNYDLGLMH
ncbi:TPA: phage N-6-adenine-methyltransferase [Enterobacter asburiae]